VTVVTGNLSMIFSNVLSQMLLQLATSRKSGHFKRKRFWSAGVMEYLSIDQHDKWGRFGLWLHLATDPFNSRVAWLKIWWCNRNPHLLINYYLEAGRKVGGMCLTIFPSSACFQFF
jgi:hypothetical protein